MRIRVYSAALAAILSLGTLAVAARPAHADKKTTYKIATYALGAGTLYALMKKKHTLALLGAAGTYLAYRQWKKADRNERPARRR